MAEKLVDHIDNHEELEKYLADKASKHNHYKYYSKRSFVETIVERKKLYLSNGANWNDRKDRELFNNEEGFTNFGLCFSFSKSESVAMWMLYGGRGKNGLMVDFRQTDIKRILGVHSIKIGYWNEGKFIEEKELGRDNFDIAITDVLYYGDSDKDENCYEVKRSNETADVEKSIVDKISRVRKSYAWNYENECRLIVKIANENLTEQSSAVQIDLSQQELSDLRLRTYHSPNYAGEQEYNKSTLKGEIDWDLDK